MLAAQVRRETTVMVYADAFWIIGIGLVASLVSVTLLRKPARVSRPVEAH